MIIKREYVKFQTLLSRDEKSKKVFMNAFAKSYVGESEEFRQNAFNYLMTECLAQRDMGWAFHGIVDLIEGFRKLDEEFPYDNGLTYNDVTSVEIGWRDEKSMRLYLLHRPLPLETEIVQVIDLETE